MGMNDQACKNSPFLFRTFAIPTSMWRVNLMHWSMSSCRLTMRLRSLKPSCDVWWIKVSSVQFKMVSVCLEKPQIMRSTLSQRFPQHCPWKVSVFVWSQNKHLYLPCYVFGQFIFIGHHNHPDILQKWRKGGGHWGVYYCSITCSCYFREEQTSWRAVDAAVVQSGQQEECSHPTTDAAQHSVSTLLLLCCSKVQTGSMCLFWYSSCFTDGSFCGKCACVIKSTKEVGPPPPPTSPLVPA